MNRTRLIRNRLQQTRIKVYYVCESIKPLFTF